MYTVIHEQIISGWNSRSCPRGKGGKMSRFLVPMLIGCAIGAAMGYFGQCSSGACPLTSTWWRGALYGATLGGLFAFSTNS